MINVNTNKFFHLTIGGTRVSFVDYFRPATYTDWKGGRVPLFSVDKRLTTVIDLNNDLEAIFGKFKSNYRNEIRKAQNLGVVTLKDSNVDEFVRVYNDFAEHKGLHPIARTHVTKYPVYVITKAVYNDVVLTYHVTIYDVESKVARLLYSTSARLQDNNEIDPKIIGYANRLLHYSDLEMCKNDGMIIYDFAGIGKTGEGPIASFKKGFGGEIVETIKLYSPVLTFVKFIKGLRNVGK